MLLTALATEVLRRTCVDGETTTSMQGLSLLRFGSTALEGRGFIQPSVCVVVQGQKVARAGVDTTFRYGAGDFLVTSIEMPLAGRVIGVSEAKPYLAVAFALSPHEVLKAAADAKLSIPRTPHDAPAMLVGKTDSHLLDVVLRAVSALDDERGARFLAPLLRRELAYRLLTGPHAAAVYESALLARQDDGVGRAVSWIREHFKEPLRVERVAKLANMSVSSLHHKFKTAVTMGPLQYQKHLRLQEARRLLLSDLADATHAAFEVGYKSSSQFTREYRRQFGEPPLRDVRQTRFAESGKKDTGVGKNGKSSRRSL